MSDPKNTTTTQQPHPCRWCGAPVGDAHVGLPGPCPGTPAAIARNRYKASLYR